MTTRPTAEEPGVRDALRAHLLAMADDELILGHRHAEWTGFGPDIESDVALSSIAQDELGHARLLYQQVVALDGGDEEAVDALAFGRAPEAYRNAVLLERPNGGPADGALDPDLTPAPGPGPSAYVGDWGFTIVRMFFYDLADAVRLAAWARGGLAAVADVARTLEREERYHRLFGETWLRRLASATPQSRARVQRLVETLWPDGREILGPISGEDRLLTAGVLGEGTAVQERRWRAEVEAILNDLGLRVPEAAPAGRSREDHSSDLARLLQEMTSVWRSDPGARW